MQDLPILGDHDVVGVPVTNPEDGERAGECFNGLGQLVSVVLCGLVIVSGPLVQLQRRHHASPLLTYCGITFLLQMDDDYWEGQHIFSEVNYLNILCS